MSFKHINPGYGMLFYNQRFSTYENFTYNPKFGVSFYNDGERDGIPVYCGADTTDLWLKFDMYFHAEQEAYAIYASIADGNKYLLQIERFQDSLKVTALRDSDNLSVEGDDTKIKTGAVNTFWMHVKSAKNSQLSATVAVNGKIIIDGECSTDNYSGNCLAKMGIRIDNSYRLPMSNLIISDAEIDLNEIIVRVDSSGVDTTMAENDGKYSTVEVGGYVLQTLDTSSLYNIFGADGKVTGMVALAAPAYYEGDYEDQEIHYLICRKVDGDNVTDYVIDFDEDSNEDYIWDAVHYLEPAPDPEIPAFIEDYLPVCAEQLPITSDTTIASLNGLKIGWVARELLLL